MNRKILNVYKNKYMLVFVVMTLLNQKDISIFNDFYNSIINK